MENRIIIIESLLMTDAEFLTKCLLLLYDKQEEDEQEIEDSVHQNNVGFNKSDAKFLTDLAIRAKEMGITAFVKSKHFIDDNLRKRMRKYTRQLSNYLTDEELGI